MESEYDCKFEEMKKYIPFLENMITRLESTSTSFSNPRQAQLDKIRSLRDLLSNKKKRMKMENLLKCEQVLVNLYAKVEQRDTLSSSKKITDSGFSIETPTLKEKSDLEAVRNKLKTVVKRQESVQDTLPEILPRSEVNDVHTSGTKEPALFQRRPNLTNKDTEEAENLPPDSASKRNYTRVLVSPEPSSSSWSPSKLPSEKLFSRRSPRKSPRRYSPSYHKKERKKSKEWQTRKQRDLNITLNVPQASMNSLNTKDILARIIHCSDGDVNIDTLRVLRGQILEELQKIGAKDDISDLILKSYNTNTSKKKKSVKKEEIEEGELSDSESEAIESIYGSLVVKEPALSKTSSEDNQPRKIQICLVINADNKSEGNLKDLSKQGNADFPELVMYENKEGNKVNADDDNGNNDQEQSHTKITSNLINDVAMSGDKCENNKSDTQKFAIDKNIKAAQTIDDNSVPANNDGITSTKENLLKPSDDTDKSIMKDEATKFSANFYKPLTGSINSEISESAKITERVSTDQVTPDTITKVPTSTSDNKLHVEGMLPKIQKSPEIPLLHERTIEKQPSDNTLSEIDILQALKNEILSEITVPGTESTTPLLHQPKVIKVANAQTNQVLPKKRISIEKYKEKSVTSSQSNFTQISPKEEQVKKISLKLTDKECERFFNVPKISFDDEDESLEEDDDENINAIDVYGDLAPKSPDHDDSNSIASTPPVIIPVDPIKSVPANYETDIDMRTLPLLSPNSSKVHKNVTITSSTDSVVNRPKVDIKTDNNSQNRPMLIDPRIRRDRNSNNNPSPNPHISNPERTRQFVSGPSNSISNTIMTPNARTYEMTPTHHSFEMDQSNRNHVYVPTIASWEREKSVSKDTRTWETTDSNGERRSRIDDVRESCWNSQTDEISLKKRFSDSFNSDIYGNGPTNNRQMDQREDMYRSDGSKIPSYLINEAPMTPLPSFGRSECPPTPNHPFGRLECPPTPTHSFGRLECPPTPSHPFGRSDCPPTPSHPFGRLDCPPTPSHPFGRLDCPSTPSHPFGRLDCPSTPSQPFGRLECPPTPSHSFGRLECPPTPSHSFGRTDCPLTPSHPFGRSECPSTPSHPFGRSEVQPLLLGMVDCSTTSNNTFIGSDGSSTPTPIFGRNERAPNTGHMFVKSVSKTNQYGRCDFNNQSFTKDPRLNRKSDTESKLLFDERDQTYYKDQERYRSSSYSSQKSNSGSSNYRNYDRDLSTGRNSRYKYYAPELSGRQYSKDQERRDRFTGRSVSKDYESSRAYDRDRWYDSDKRRYDEHESRREKSSGRSATVEELRSSARSNSIINNTSKERNTLSVESNTGRSFTIDTSINATFQKIIDSAKEIQGFVDSFDVRRQRASSVGRSLTREPSVGQGSLSVSKSNKNENKRQAFQRASSVGRDVLNANKDDRSFQEIKADFKSCKFSRNKYFDVKSTELRTNYKSKITTERNSHSKKDMYMKQNNEQRLPENAKSSYSPRMNYRDPRMRKLTKSITDRRDSDTNNRCKSGIVYSNDNILTGSVLTSGYGVKNYKIPKIKRPTEEKEDTLEKSNILSKNDEREKRKSNGNTKETGLSKDKSHTKEQKVSANDSSVDKNNVGENVAVGNSTEKRQTRSSKKNVEDRDENISAKTRKCKKLIYNSDSDEGTMTKNADNVIEMKTVNILVKDSEINVDSNNKEKCEFENKAHREDVDQDNLEKKDVDPDLKEISRKCEGNGDFKSKYINTGSLDVTAKENGTDLIKHFTFAKEKKKDNLNLGSTVYDMGFGAEDLEMFADHVVSDPVTDNITALIADLDNDLNTTKNDTSHNFTKEITLENMMQNISSQEDNKNKSIKTLEDISKISDDKIKEISGEVSGNGNSDLSTSMKVKNKCAQAFEDVSKIPSDKIVISPEISVESTLINTLNSVKTNNDTLVKKAQLSNIANSVNNDQTLAKMNKVSEDKDIEISAKISVDGSSGLNNSLCSENMNKEMLANKVTLSINANPENMLKDSAANTPTQSDARRNSENKRNLEIILTSSSFTTKSTNENIDSTTESERTEKRNEDKLKLDDNIDGCSTPDSTINTDDTQFKLNNEEGLPASTNEVTSTESVDLKPCSAKDITPGLDSIGNLLSILQDKSKIKELLSMLGEQSSENDKIKKKLEKLSEIVSDDEEESSDISKVKLDQIEIEKFNASEMRHTNIIKSDTTDVKQIDVQEDEPLIKDISVVSVHNSNVSDCSKISDTEDMTLCPDINIQNVDTKSTKKSGKKNKYMKRPKGKSKKGVGVAGKRLTRATAAESKPKVKKIPRELMMLQEDIKEMFIRDEVLSATGIRMCRLAKLVDEKVSPPKEEQTTTEVEPVVILEKFKVTSEKNNETEKNKKKKILPKNKVKSLNDSVLETDLTVKQKPGPKSKTKNEKDSDPYVFETDLSCDTVAEKTSDGSSSNTDSESDSLASYKSFSSTELLSDLKKKVKRKRPGWQAGVIKPRSKKKKADLRYPGPMPVDATEDPQANLKVLMPDLNCFTDRNYCFRKNQDSYSCRLCSFTGTDIVLHYRNQHPHIEIPLSRMTPEVAKDAIEQCVEINFKAISKITSDKYVCTFCFKEFVNSKSVLEQFFWHIVSMHTGEYKQNCSQCVNVQECPFNLDIPPPPKDTKGQLIGFICKKCNFTQISLENLKTHVIVRHNDEQTAVYTINLSVMSKKCLSSLLRRSETDQTTLSRNSIISNQALADVSQICIDSIEKSDEGTKTRKSTRKASIMTPLSIKSKITFEGDDNISEVSDLVSDPDERSIKVERMDSENVDTISNNEECLATDGSEMDKPSETEDQSQSEALECSQPQPSSDIINCPHFKVNVTETGAKEYFCCINDNYHFKTTLLISMKKHVQSKHSENWDGYCFVCKVIVTPQGTHRFRDCLQHYLDNHMDDFPIFEKDITKPVSARLPVVAADTPVENSSTTKSYINVRPISELITRTEDKNLPQDSAALPIIQSVMSLGTSVVETPQQSLEFPVVQEKQAAKIKIKYEEYVAEVASKKYYLIIQAMMTQDILVKLFKCAGRYCLYATDSTKEALAHATTHQRVGGIDALNCCYCNFDSANNAVDLVMHVFKSHGNCQYCCQQCFYRASSSQAVASHISRVHGVTPVPGSVLRTTSVSTISLPKYNMLSREKAVSYYVCGYKDLTDCKFRAYTPDKFCEHLMQRHAAASSHACYICLAEFPMATALVQHMKNHGLKLYQCTWCVHGADTETEMLDHMSIEHPNNQPQAYIRIITNKDGSNVQRVLPLAILNKHKLPTTDVTPPATKEYPVREAERSIEMEALIKPFMTESTEPTAETTEPLETTETLIQTTETVIPTIEIPEELIEQSQDIKPVVNVQNPEPLPQASQVIQTPSLTPTVSILPTPSDSDPPPVVSHLPQDTASLVTSLPVTPLDTEIITPKTEPQESRSSISDIIVLESDDEEKPTAPIASTTSTAPTATTAPTANQSVIDLSDDEMSTSLKKETPKIISNSNLFTCPQCRQICKNMGGFKKHVSSCVTNASSGFQCPHCTHFAENVEKITWHYVADHTIKSTFKCSLCGALLVSENSSRKHMRSAHKENNIVFSRNNKDESRFIISVKEMPKEKVLPKRKLSGSKIDPVPAKRRFEPQEIDQLPITPILDQLVYCSRCEFSTKVRLNMVRHLQLHAEQQPVPQTAPVNPVPHLESNERHFDKMVNLASSSIVNRTPDKSRPEHAPSVTVLIPPEAATRYPKYVPERQRLTCGAKGCSYISVDEAMLRRHWDALHLGASDFHCVHCPAHQHLDTSKPLTATRIVSHLKMHDSTLYACSLCSYYHFKREAIEKHLSEIHKTGRLMVVREDSSAPVSSTPLQSSTAPTMDLKPWQCGLCKFKSMLRPEVVDHCSKFHQSKMQFKCAYCPFRTSAIENVTKHQINCHAGKPEEVFYYYYREGSIPDYEDGTPRWVKQRQKAGPSEPEIKVEETSVTPLTKTVPAAVTSPLTIDLNLVKKEVNDTVTSVASPTSNIQDLCKQFGQFCEPNGIKFKCPLCSVVVEDTRDSMQSHLYEELNYRKWSCGLCSYKAFHKAGLSDHMSSEHRRQYDHIELPADVNIERWVSAVLDHQTSIINKHRDNLAKQKTVVDTSKPSSSAEVVISKEPVQKYCEKDLETAFGSFGSPSCDMLCCPKCDFLSKAEVGMRDHLEMELNKIRWCCTNCPENFQTYHEAQFHCKGHDGPSRPVEALRDPAMRATWVSTTIQKQKKDMENMVTPSASESLTVERPVPDTDNSLLVVRYEERVPTPDQVHVRRKRQGPESDDEKLVIDEEPAKKKAAKQCPYCDYKTVYHNNLKIHMLSHFGLKSYSCGYCSFSNCTKKYVTKHVEEIHPGQIIDVKTTPLPPEATQLYTNLNNPASICLVCEKPVPETEIRTHLHDNVRPEYSNSPCVQKCCICSKLFSKSITVMEHHKIAHPGEPLNYTSYKIETDTIAFKCGYCSNKFKNVELYRRHRMAVHPSLPFKIIMENLKETSISHSSTSEIKQSDVATPQRRCARKSTTKLPNSVAKKSTTKLPHTVPCISDDEYSYYGTKPSPLEEHANVTTMMSFCNMMVPFSLKQLSVHLNIEPQVVVADINTTKSDYKG